MGNTSSNLSQKGGEIKTVFDVEAGKIPQLPTGVDIQKTIDESEANSKADSNNSDNSSTSDSKNILTCPSWWNLQKTRGRIPTAVLLESYGKEYSYLFSKSCGQHKADLKQCIQKHNYDPLNMTSWYGACGLYHELETLCTKKMIFSIDKNCGSSTGGGIFGSSSVLDKAVKYVENTPNDVMIASVGSNSIKFSEDMKSIGKCVKMIAPNGLSEEEKKKGEKEYNMKKGAFSRFTGGM